MTTKPNYCSLIGRLKAEFRVDSLQNTDHQRGYNEGLDTAIALIRAFASEPATVEKVAVRLARSKYKCPWDNLSIPTQSAYIARAKAALSVLTEDTHGK